MTAAGVALAELVAVRSWTRRRSGQCVCCWASQQRATAAGARGRRRRPARWGAQLNGRDVGLCARHHAALIELRTQRDPRHTCHGGRCRRDGTAVALCERHAAELVDVGVPEMTAPPVLLLTCTGCEQVREHPRGEPLRAECLDPDCGGWLLTAAAGLTLAGLTLAGLRLAARRVAQRTR